MEKEKNKYLKEYLIEFKDLLSGECYECYITNYDSELAVFSARRKMRKELNGQNIDKYELVGVNIIGIV